MSVTHSTLCHNWAHQLRESQNANSMSFHRNKLYSYSTVIGQRIELEGETVYLLNEGFFSHSTAKHQGHMHSAIPVYAKQFPFKEGEFLYPCSGLGSWNGTVAKNDMVDFAMTYCRHLYESFLEFKTSKSLELEGAKKSYRIWGHLLDWCEVTKCTTIKQLLRLTNETWYNKKLWQYHRDKKVVPALKAMLRALLEKKPLPEVVDIVCGSGTYQAWVKRTEGIRKAKATRSINAMLGFSTGSKYDSWGAYYNSYPQNYKACSSNPSYVRLRARVKEGKLTSAQIEKMKQKGIYEKELLRIKKANLEINMSLEESRKRAERRYNSKERLERHIGYYWDYRRVHEFTHDGVTIQLTHCTRSKMSENDFNAFCKMSKEEQQAFIKRERAALFLRFTEEIRRHEEWEARWAEEQKEHARLEAMRQEKKQYIEDKKAEGVSGYIQLWHEGLISDSQLYNKGTLRGGNALLRFNKDRNIVQTSKGIEVGIEECKRLWALISRWHANATTFISDKVCSTLSEWTISRYENDIMIAGCHAISYVEMEDLARDLGLI